MPKAESGASMADGAAAPVTWICKHGHCSYIAKYDGYCGVHSPEKKAGREKKRERVDELETENARLREAQRDWQKERCDLFDEIKAMHQRAGISDGG